MPAPGKLRDNLGLSGAAAEAARQTLREALSAHAQHDQQALLLPQPLPMAQPETAVPAAWEGPHPPEDADEVTADYFRKMPLGPGWISSSATARCGRAS